MDSLSTDRQRHVHPIVDEKRNIVPPRDLMQLGRLSDEGSGVSLLISILDDADSYLP